MFSASLLSALGGVFSLVFLAIALYVYASLLRQISARNSFLEPPPLRVFGAPEALLAFGLIALLLLNVLASFSGRSVELSSRVLLENLLVTVAIVLFIVAVLLFRGFDLNWLTGFSRMSFRRAIATAIFLLVMAYPLIVLAERISQGFIGDDSTRQSIIDLFTGSPTINQRMMVIFFAVAVAPIVEEFLFRLFLYGVLKRYFGRVVGVVFNSLLFGAVHGHLPSFAALFVLGVCFTIAYEWSGSILVSMTMHALFNSVSLIALAFPDIFSQ